MSLATVSKNATDRVPLLTAERLNCAEITTGNCNSKPELPFSKVYTTRRWRIFRGQKPMREFLRSPNEYGYLTLSFTPNTRFNASVSSVYTGKMHLAHFAGAPEQTVDEYKTSPSFTELNAKVSYTFNLPSVDSGLEIFGGVKNLTNAYQSDFDSGKNRDSNYVYMAPECPAPFIWA
jgi:outer membrane receptor protein involved in Fe transport